MSTKVEPFLNLFSDHAGHSERGVTVISRSRFLALL